MSNLSNEFEFSNQPSSSYNTPDYKPAGKGLMRKPAILCIPTFIESLKSGRKYCSEYALPIVR